jgi:glycosyltransferase involved in cell wall biosynthesis
VPTSRELWSALATAELAVQPSEREGFGLFPLEAMALGLPVVYCESPESAVGELVRDGREGLACAPDADALARALEGLLAAPERRRQLAEAARRRAEEYSWDRVASLYIEWLGLPGAR